MADARMSWLEARLKARQEALSRILATKPATKAQEFWRQAFVQRALTSVEARHQRAGIYNDHLAALEHILTGSTETAPTHVTAPEEVSAKNLGDV
jgi:hypothetical protein